MKINELFDLSGKVAIITGGGDGLGYMMAMGLAEAGADVVICSRRLERCEESAKKIRKLGVKALAYQCDLNHSENVDEIVTNTLNKLGKIDILVNNSGKTWGASPEKIGMEEWKKVIDVNINGTFSVTQRVGKEMIKRGEGKIINISSIAGLRGMDPEYLNSLPYCTSKGALIVFTQDLAVKWAKYNININCIAPGWFDTKMTRRVIENSGDKILARIALKRLGSNKDIKGAVVFLSSRASDYITGQVLAVDGGFSSW